MGRLVSYILGRRQEKRPPSPRLLAALAVLLLIGMLYVGGQDSKRLITVGCNTGPFASNESCISDAGDGWSYTKSVGTLDMRYCDKMSLDAAELLITPPSPRVPVLLMKADCSALQLENRDHYCYAAQKADAETKTRHVSVLVTDAHCGDAHFFQGQNILPLEESPDKAHDWNTPFPGIPELQ